MVAVFGHQDIVGACALTAPLARLEALEESVCPD